MGSDYGSDGEERGWKHGKHGKKHHEHGHREHEHREFEHREHEHREHEHREHEFREHEHRREWEHPVGHVGHHYAPAHLGHGAHGAFAPPGYEHHAEHERGFGHEFSHEGFQEAPPSGYRIALSSDAPFPEHHRTGAPPFYDADGGPVFIGSAIFENSVQPCKVCPSLYPPCRVPFGNQEIHHHGRYDLLPITPAMHWVFTKEGEIPYGCRPVEGGYDENGTKLYHAVAMFHGFEIPGKTGHHLGGAAIPFDGREHVVRHDYKILCWR